MTTRKETDVFDDIEGLVLSEARKAYSETVIDHFMNPRNVGIIEKADCHTFMTGICGDTIGFYVKLDGDRIGQVTFMTNGCGPTIACASAMTCMAQGRTIKEASNINGEQLIAFLGGLPLENTHCADLAVNTLRGALDKAPVNGS
jgi:nitrogen fixation NifU-like protein